MQGQKNLLIVDDDAIIALNEKTQLEKYGYAVSIAYSGEEALSLIKAEPQIDLVLMDINLGKGIDGTEAAELILKVRELPIIFLSAHTEAKIVEKSEKTTSYGYIVKNTAIAVVDASIKMAFKLFNANKELTEKSQVLHVRSQLLDNIIKSFPGIIFWKNENFVYEGCSTTFAQKTGFSSITEILGKTDFELPWKNHEAEQYRQDDILTMSSNEPRLHIIESQHQKNGQIAWYDTSKIPLFALDGSIKGVLGVSIDITELKKAETQLKNYRKKLDFAMEISGLGEWAYYVNTGKIKRNEVWSRMLGYEPSEVDDSYRFSEERIHLEDCEKVITAFKSFTSGQADSYKAIYRYRTKDGSYKWIQDSAKVFEYDDEGKPLLVLGAHLDIDELKKTEESLAASRNLLDAIINSSPNVIIFALDKQYRYIAFNSKHKEVIQQIWGKEIALGICMLDIIGGHEDAQKAKANFDRALRGESFVLVEDYGDESLSRQSWIDYWSPIKDDKGKISGISCIVLNNTKQKEAEIKINALLAEKQLLLKEIHHRIKNNMNTIRSLLSLQGDISPEQAVKLALGDAASRVQSMSLLYDELYKTENFKDISAEAYLSSLLDSIVSNFPNRQIIELQKDMQDFMLDARQLQPLGIIINEIITNIMKYAFAGKTKGTIVFSASKTNDTISIIVADDGIGMPEHISFENSTGFGLQLVQALTQQLKGAIQIERGNGTRIVLQFRA